MSVLLVLVCFIKRNLKYELNITLYYIDWLLLGKILSHCVSKCCIKNKPMVNKLLNKQIKNQMTSRPIDREGRGQDNEQHSH